jgi:c-di-GMP-binding flagellar brake protein YcgR
MSVLGILAVAVGVLAVITLLIIGLGGEQSSWLQFYARGKEAGFSLAEINYLKGIALERKLDEPMSVFWSERALDKIIKIVSAQKKDEGSDKQPETLAFMSKLYDFRKRVEFERPRYKSGLKSTRMINAGTHFRVIIEGLGVFNSTLLSNSQKSLIASVPSGRRLPEGFKWDGKKISVYFWRAEDAGYVFDSYVMEETHDGKVPVIKIGHTDTLLRTQKRKSVRAKSRISAFLYILRRIEGAYEKPEKVPGMKCIIEDISEDGASVFIGGRAKPDMQIKLQFYIGELQVVMSGTVKAVEYNLDKNQSLIHMQAVPPSHRMKTIILSYVYNVYDEDETAP